MLKWASIVVCSLVLVAWGVSIRRHMYGALPRALVSLSPGLIQLTFLQFSQPETDLGWTWHGGMERDEDVLTADQLTYRVRDSFTCRPRCWRHLLGVTLNLPLWTLFLLVAAPTAFLWRLEPRRFPPGHCRKCGYDLRGNVSGRCPECGTEAGQSG